MLNKSSLTNVAASCNHGASRLLLVAAVLCLTSFCEPRLNAATTVAYLQQIPQHPPGSKYPSLQIPTNPNTPAPVLPLYGPFNLPGYGNTVYVTVSCPPLNANCTLPHLTWGHSKAAENKSTSNGAYNWGTDTNALSLYNDNGNGNETYVLTFYFDGISPPNPQDLILVVASLKDGSTASVSGLDNNGVAAKLSNKNGGEYTLPSNSTWTWCWPGCLSTAATIFPAVGFPTLTFRSGYPWNNATDDRNTGWDLYQPNSPNLISLTLNVTQVLGDGLGFTLGYRACITLVGNTGPATPIVPFALYDIDTTTGTATNARALGMNADWGIAFSPLSPDGTLYALAKNQGTLLKVDPITGVATQLTPTGIVPFFAGGALAADPTSGTLYGMDVNGNLSIVNTGAPATPIGQVSDGGTNPFFAAMAFDSSGNLFVVDTNNYILQKVDKSTAKAVGKPISLIPPSKIRDVSAGLAIDPWSGTAYYVDGGSNSLYTLDLATGKMKVVGPLIGTNSASLAGLAFIESPVDKFGVCPVHVPPLP